MKLATLARPLIASRLGEMTTSFLFLFFAGHYLSEALGPASFAWAFSSFISVIGIGLFSTLLVEVPAASRESPEKKAIFLSTTLTLAGALGLFVSAAVLCHAYFFSGPTSQSQHTLMAMSLSIPAIYCQITFFNHLNAEGNAKYELYWVWSLNTLFVMAIALYAHNNWSITVLEFIFCYVGLRWVWVALAIIIFLYHRYPHRNIWRLDQGPLRQHVNFLLKGVPLALCFGAESFLYFAFSLISKGLGDVQLSAFQISLHFLSIIYMISIGIGNATAILIAGDAHETAPPLASARLIEGLKFGGVLMLPCLAVCLFFPKSVALVYTSDTQVVELAAGFIQLATPFLVFEFVYVILRMTLRSLGDAWLPTAMTIACLNVIGLSLTWLFMAFYQASIHSIMLALNTCTFVLMILLIVRLTAVSRRIKRKIQAS